MNWRKKRNHLTPLPKLKLVPETPEWRAETRIYRFGLFVLGKYMGEVTLMGDNNGHARTRVLDQALDQRSEFITLVPRRPASARDEPIEEGVRHVSFPARG